MLSLKGLIMEIHFRYDRIITEKATMLAQYLASGVQEEEEQCVRRVVTSLTCCINYDLL